MSLRPGADFQGRWSVFWATSYEFEHRVFDQYWLPRLGEPPLNATLLIDGAQLAKTWAELPPGEAWRLRRVNRDYLVRGVHVSSGAFHPKTYFFANQHEGVLLVGSGNLTLNGLEEGHEDFSRFTSRDRVGLAAIRQWRDWSSRVVRLLDDPAIASRWADAMQKAPWLDGAAESSPLVTNWDIPLLTQFVDGLSAPIDELHVMAPFFDEEASVLVRLISRLTPRRVVLYAGKDMSVSGQHLINALGADQRDVVVHGFQPHRFVHAKLVAAILGERGRLLSGSANVSRAAMLGTVGGKFGNVEIGVLLDATAELVRAALVPDGLVLTGLPLAQIAGLTYRTSAEGSGPPLTLLSATLRPDGRVSVAHRGVHDGTLYLAGASGRQRLKGAATAEALELAEGDILVWLADESGEVLSNHVPVDDPSRLAAWLQSRAEPHEQPRELDPRDIATPIGAMLERLHQACVFDIEETSAAARVRGAAQDTEDSDFWDRLLQEELRLDARVERYAGLRHHGFGDDDEVLRLLRTLLDEVPAERHLRLLRALGQEDKPEATGIGQLWSPDRRLQVRVFNLLDRWSRALGDRRLRWISPVAPVRNYAALVWALAECREGAYLPADHVAQLAETLFGAFLRTERSAGFLTSLTAEERAEALATLPDEAQSAAAALAYVALQPTWQQMGAARQTVFAWQPFLVHALEWGVFRPNQVAAVIAGVLIGTPVSVTELVSRLSWASTYIDDAHWCASMQRELGLTGVSLKADHVHTLYDLTLEVAGVDEPLGDPRLVVLARRALDYRHAQGLVMRFPSGRLSLHLGGQAFARVGRLDFESAERVTQERLAQMEANAAGWRAILVPERATASAG